jgi:aminopeptidase N
MTAKCTYHTTITADSRYTNLLSNGDVEHEKIDLGDGRSKIIYKNDVTPMATYLFFLGVGTYKTFSYEFEYPDGDTFMLELLVPPESQKEKAEIALKILHDAIMWIYLFTGRDTYLNKDAAIELFDLIKQRELIKQSGEVCDQSLIDKILKLHEGRHWGYKYTGTVYREIGMQNSDYGGMENVGNTTITTNRIMPFDDMTDGSFEYMIAVKVHEFYHNLNGSEVTGRSPFEIWLNEAVTVFIEKEHAKFVFGDDYIRLEAAHSFLVPTVGTFDSDLHPASMPIEPDGFNDPNELITGVTYVKAPEFVRMVETILAKEKFVEALDLYHTRYRHSNASRADWVKCMEEVSGLNLQKMAHAWLKNPGFPIVEVSDEIFYQDEGVFVIKAKQTGFKGSEIWEFPFDIALCDKNGQILSSQVYYVDSENFEIRFENILSKPAYISYNRSYSFFGKVEFDFDYQKLLMIAKNDSDICVRYNAMYELFDMLKLRILNGGEISEMKEFLDYQIHLMSDVDLISNISDGLLANFETVSDEKFSHSYAELFNTNKKIRKYFAENYKEQILELYQKYNSMQFEGSYVDSRCKELKFRAVKNRLLTYLAELDNDYIYQILKDQFYNSKNASDRVHAFHLYLNTTAKDKKALILEYQTVACKNLVAWETFLSAVARNNSVDHLDLIREVESLEHFRIDQANDQRALIVGFAMNKKNSLLKPEGRAYLKEKVIQLAQINEYSTGRLLKVFGAIDKLEKSYRADVYKILVDLIDALDSKAYPSVFNTVKRIMAGSPLAKADYESKYL